MMGLIQQDSRNYYDLSYCEQSKGLGDAYFFKPAGDVGFGCN